MGSQQNSNSTNSVESKSSKSKKPLEDTTSKSLLNDSLSYRGFKSEGMSSGSCDSTLSVQTSDKPCPPSPSTIPYTFEWREGGDSVLVTGSFCNWNKRFVMSFNANTNTFEATLPLLKNTYQFKFIVDSEWKCSSYLPITTDKNNNMNNYIDLTNSNNASVEIRHSKASRNGEATSRAKANGSGGHKGRDVPYGNAFPGKMELNSDAPNVPMIYNNKMNMKSRIDNANVGNASYLKFEEKNVLSENNAFKMVKMPSHVNLNHLGMKCECHKGFVMVCAVFRVRKKFTSFVYCHPYKI